MWWLSRRLWFTIYLVIDEADITMANPPVFDVHQDIISCSIDDVNLFDDSTQAQRITFDIFIENFH